MSKHYTVTLTAIAIIDFVTSESSDHLDMHAGETLETRVMHVNFVTSDQDRAAGKSFLWRYVLWLLTLHASYCPSDENSKIGMEKVESPIG